MPTFQIQGPDGRTFRVTGDTAEGAVAALQQMNQPPALDAGADDIRVAGPDGSSFSFPVGTPQDTIETAMKSHYGQGQGGGDPAYQQKLETALRNADAAGDTDAARTLAAEIVKVRGGGAAQPRDLLAPRDLLSGTGDGPWTKYGPGSQYTPEQQRSLALASARRRREEGGMPPGFVPDPPPGFQLDSAAPASPQYGGAAMNTTAGANETLYGVLGAPVDLMRGAMNFGIRGVNAAAGTDMAPIADDSFGGSRFIAQSMGGISPVLDPQNTVAASTTDRLARGAGAGIAGTVLPAGIVAGAGRAGLIGEQAAQMGAAAVGRAGSTYDVALGAAGGAGSAAGQELAPNGYEGLGSLVGGIAGSAAAMGTGALASGARHVAAPFTAGGRDRLAAQRIDAAATDPEALRRSLDNAPGQILPGSQPTTFQQTGDLGVGALERGAAVRIPDQFAQRRADQNAAQTEALGGIETGGAPEKVAASVRGRLEQIEAESERMIAEATTAAQGRATALGAPQAPEVAGGNMRSALEAARAQAKEQERALWSAVDPDGTLTLGLSNTRKSAHDLAEDMSPLAQPMTETERQIYGAIGKAGETVSFGAMRDLQQNIKAALRAERMANGESPVYRRMSIVSAGIAKDFDAAVAGKVAQEAQAVASGHMSPADTIEARWTRKIEEWREGRQAAAGGDSRSAPVGYAGGGASGIPGSYGTGGQAFGQSGGPAGNPGLQGNAGSQTFDAAALGRLNAANAATRDRVGTFDNRTLGPMRQRPSTAAPYTMPSGVVPQQVFNSGIKSFEAIGQLRAAIGPQAADEAVQGYAVGEVLRVAGRPDGTLDPARLAAWRRSHANALRAVPGLDARLSDAGTASQAIAEVAIARKAASDNAQKGALGRLLQVDDPQDVTRIVGGIFSAQDSAQRMRSIRQAIAGDTEAEQGLRRAVVDHLTSKFIGNTEAGSSGIGTIKSDGFQNFVRQNASALEAAGFKGSEMRTFEDIAEDLQRANRSIASVKNPGGSDTAQNLHQIGKDGSPFSAVARMILAPGGVGLGVGFASGNAAGIAAGAAAAAFGAMRNAGLRTVDDLIADALLNPQRARLLLSKVKPGDERSRWEALSASFGQSAARALAQDSEQPRDGRRAEVGPLTGIRHFSSATPTASAPRRKLEPREAIAELLLQKQPEKPRASESMKRIAEALQSRRAA